MSNETKRDVFEKMKWELISNLANTIDQNGGLRPLEDATKVGENYATRYAAALPDDLPVIPKVWGDTIEEFKANHYRLSEIFTEWDWNYDEQELIARAWLDGYQVED